MRWTSLGRLAPTPCRVAGPEGRVPAPSITRRLMALALLAQFALPTAHAQTRNSDLDRIRDDITRMKKRLEDRHSQQKSAERDLEEADMELGIRTRELEVAVTLQ